MDLGKKISFTVTAQFNQKGNKYSGTNNYGYTATLKWTFTPSALYS